MSGARSGISTPVFQAVLAAPFGALGARLQDERLAELVFLPVPDAAPAPRLAPAPSAEGAALLQRLAEELERYFRAPAHRFKLPALPPGTPFRQRVWAALLNIPAGQTLTYGELARRVGSAPRAVGQAVGDNPWPILIPCHRVVAADGSLGGFMHSRVGFSQDIKRWLLRHEGAR